jgi:hypothetical protein
MDDDNILKLARMPGRADNLRKLAQLNRRAGPAEWPAPDIANGHDDGPERLVIGNAAELDQRVLPKLEWYVEDILPVGLGIIVGKPKMRKSWIAVDIWTSCTQGQRALRKYPTRQCEALYIALEDNERRLQSRLRKFLAGEPVPANLSYTFACPSGQACLDAIDRYLDEHPACRLVIVDPFAKVRGLPDGRRANAFQQDYADVGAFHALAWRRGIALLLVHHARKEDAADPFDSINGTTGIMAAADTVLILTGKRYDLVATLSVTGRDIENPGEFALEWDAAACRFKVLGEAGTVRQETMQDKIFNFLREQKEPVSVSEIAAELQISQGTIHTTLGRLKKRGAIERKEKNKWQTRGR